MPTHTYGKNNSDHIQFNYAINLIVDSTASHCSQYFSICKLLSGICNNKVIINEYLFPKVGNM